jgi:hypothetical protein
LKGKLRRSDYEIQQAEDAKLVGFTKNRLTFPVALTLYVYERYDFNIFTFRFEEYNMQGSSFVPDTWYFIAVASPV